MSQDLEWFRVSDLELRTIMIQDLEYRTIETRFYQIRLYQLRLYQIRLVLQGAAKGGGAAGRKDSEAGARLARPPLDMQAH